MTIISSKAQLEELIDRFAIEMKVKLVRRHDMGWRDDDVISMLHRLDEERDELFLELTRYIKLPWAERSGRLNREGLQHQLDRIREEAADVANIAMMIQDLASYDARPWNEVDSER